MKTIEKLNSHYDRLAKINKISSAFSGILILIACIFMFGFGYYAAGCVFLVASFLVSQGTTVYVNNNLEYKE